MNKKKLRLKFKQLKRDKEKYHILQNKKRVGYVAVTRYKSSAEDTGWPIGIDKKKPKFWIELEVNKKHRNKGIGTEAYRFARRTVPKDTQHVTAFIKDSNFASVRSAEKAGFKKSKSFKFSPERIAQYLSRRKKDRYSKYTGKPYAK